jgi:hypothetical protein
MFIPMPKKPVWTPGDIAKTSTKPPKPAPEPQSVAAPAAPSPATAPSTDPLAADLAALGLTVPFTIREGRRFKFILVETWPVSVNWPQAHAAMLAKGYILDLMNGACWFSDRY